jgi:hypothetical protein
MFAKFSSCPFSLTLIGVSVSGDQCCISVSHPSEDSRTKHINEKLEAFTAHNNGVNDYKEHLREAVAKRAVDHVIVITSHGPRSTHIQRYRWSAEMKRFNHSFNFDF